MDFANNEIQYACSCQKLRCYYWDAMEDCEGGLRRRGGEGEDERIWQGFSRRVAAAVGLGLLGVAALALVEGAGVRNGGSVSLAASDLGSNGENRNLRESAAMKAFDVVKRDMDKLQADLDRVRVCLVLCAAKCLSPCCVRAEASIAFAELCHGEGAAFVPCTR